MSTKDPHASKVHRLREEIKRISNVTLGQKFTNPDDRAYWVDRLAKLTSELSALEQEARSSARKAFHK